jgi:hypothetical protein
MPPTENIHLVRACFEGINRNDIPAGPACWQPVGQMTVVPTGNTVQAATALRRERLRR